MITRQIQSYSDLLERIDGADRLSRKRIERMKEGLEEDLDRLKSRKDDMLTIAEIGVDQLISTRCRSSANYRSPPTRRR